MLRIFTYYVLPQPSQWEKESKVNMLCRELSHVVELLAFSKEAADECIKYKFNLRHHYYVAFVTETIWEGENLPTYMKVNNWEEIYKG